MNHDARIHVELTLLIDATDDVTDHRARKRQPFFQAALEGLVEHDGLQRMDRHQLEVGG